MFHPSFTTYSPYGGNIMYGESGLGNHMFYTGNTNTFRMIITNGGNVGISTPVPRYKLDVNGTINV